MGARSAVQGILGAAAAALLAAIMLLPVAQAKDVPINVEYTGTGHHGFMPDPAPHLSAAATCTSRAWLPNHFRTERSLLASRSRDRFRARRLSSNFSLGKPATASKESPASLAGCFSFSQSCVRMPPPGWTVHHPNGWGGPDATISSASEPGRSAGLDTVIHAPGAPRFFRRTWCKVKSENQTTRVLVGGATRVCLRA